MSEPPDSAAMSPVTSISTFVSGPRSPLVAMCSVLSASRTDVDACCAAARESAPAGGSTARTGARCWLHRPAVLDCVRAGYERTLEKARAPARLGANAAPVIAGCAWPRKRDLRRCWLLSGIRRVVLRALFTYAALRGPRDVDGKGRRQACSAESPRVERFAVKLTFTSA